MSRPSHGTTVTDHEVCHGWSRLVARSGRTSLSHHGLLRDVVHRYRFVAPILVHAASTDCSAQFIAAYAPNPPFAALLIPVVIAVLVTFSGVLVRYSLLNAANTARYLTASLRYFGSTGVSRRTTYKIQLTRQSTISTPSNIFWELWYHSRPGTPKSFAPMTSMDISIRPRVQPVGRTCLVSCNKPPDTLTIL